MTTDLTAGSAGAAPTRLATLAGYDAWGLLEQAEIARVAWHGEHGVAIVPVNYAVVDGALWFRVEPESHLAAECTGQRVVVEVDRMDTDSRSGWSVVVAGVPEVMAATDVPEIVDLRIWTPGTPGTFLRLAPDEVSGRRLFG